jgi:Suppressor of fused protein (SUFU)
MSDFNPDAINWEQQPVSAGGSHMVNHGHEGFENPAIFDPELDASIRGHMEEHFGPIEGSWDGVITVNAWVDIVAIAPNLNRPFWTLMTSGLSSREMNIPEGITGAAKRIELSLFVPVDWPMTGEMSSDEQWGWPVSALATLANIVHRHQTWFGIGHTITLQKPHIPYTPFSDALLTIGQEYPGTDIIYHDGEPIQILQVLLLTEDEAQYKLSHGIDPFLDLFSEHGTVITDPSRPSTIEQATPKKKKFFGKPAHPHSRGLFHDSSILNAIGSYLWSTIADNTRLDGRYGEYLVAVERVEEDMLALLIGLDDETIIYSGSFHTSSLFDEEDTLLMPALMPMPLPSQLAQFLYLLTSCQWQATE